MSGHTLAISGVRVRLRSITPDDARYVYDLRTDSKYNEHLSSVAGSVDDQRSWISRYKKREAVGQEYYFVIERLDSKNPCGLVRLYNITQQEFTWGSWILADNKPEKAALDCAMLVYKFGFRTLDKQYSIFDVARENVHTIAFHLRFGSTKTGEDSRNLYFRYTREQFDRDESKHLRAMGAANDSASKG